MLENVIQNLISRLSALLPQTMKGQSWVLQLVDIQLTLSSCEARHNVMHMLFDVVKISLMCC